MFNRTRTAFIVAFAALLLTTLVAGAKGGFDFLTVTGPGLEEPVRLDDQALLTVWLFSDFPENRTTAPETDPGPAYEITRHYVQGNGDVIFDRLHYYPESDLLFYDGIENGESEYDGEWFTAHPGVRPYFRAALAPYLSDAASVEKKEPVVAETKEPVAAQQQELVAAEEKQPADAVSESRPMDAALNVRPAGRILPSVVIFSLMLVLLVAFTYWRRKPASFS